ncbi:hypothetical protein POUND7_010671 [Theobroma cacao]
MEPSHSQMETPPLSSKESRINRYKPIWRILLISNLALGAYMFAKARKKNSSIVDNKPAKIEMEPEKSKTEADLSSAPLTPTPVYEEPPIFPVVATPPKVLEPIPENQRCELFEWILEEKRKVKPKDPEERKRIDEEKAILKQFMRSKSMPRI